MFSLNYLINAGIIAGFLLASAVIVRKDIERSKVITVIMLYLAVYYSMAYMLFSFNLYSPTRDFWFSMYIVSSAMFRYMFVFYMFEKKIKNSLLKIIIPIFIIFITVITATYTLYTADVNNIGNVEVIHSVTNMSLRIFSLMSWVLVAIIIAFMKRFILLPISILGVMISVSIYCMWGYEIYNALILIFSVYTPFALYMDFIKLSGNSTINRIYNINAAENTDFGIILIERGRGMFRNRYIDRIMEKCSVDFNIWIIEHINQFENLPTGVFTKMEFTLNDDKRYFYVMKQMPGKFVNYSSIYYLLDATKNEMMEKLSNRYTELMATETNEKVYNYDFRHKLNDVQKFLKGFSHNSFNLISVITTGMQYVDELMDKLEKEIFSAGSLDKKKERIKELYYSMENTINLSDSGVKKLFETFQMLNERTGLISQEGNSIIDINQSIKQELFFFVSNTLFQYSIDLKTEFNNREKTISFKYDTFATIIHDIIKFIIEEIEKGREHILTVKTEVNDIDNAVISFSAPIRNFNVKKIDNIINDSIFSMEEHYSPLINAVILCRSNNIDINRIDNNQLTIKLIFYE